MANHACPGGCGAQVPFHQLACKTCWFLLPKPYRDAVNAAYRRRIANPAEHRGAVQAALRWYDERAASPTSSESESTP